MLYWSIMVFINRQQPFDHKPGGDGNRHGRHADRHAAVHADSGGRRHQRHPHHYHDHDHLSI